MKITKKAKRTISYIKRVKKKLMKQADKGLFNDRIGKREWTKVREMLEGDPYFNIIVSDFEYFIYLLKEEIIFNQKLPNKEN